MDSIALEYSQEKATVAIYTLTDLSMINPTSFLALLPGNNNCFIFETCLSLYLVLSYSTLYVFVSLSLSKNLSTTFSLPMMSSLRHHPLRTILVSGHELLLDFIAMVQEQPFGCETLKILTITCKSLSNYVVSA